MTRLRQWLCGLHGHDAVLHFASGRVSMLCTSCGHESPGVTVHKPTQKPTGLRLVARQPERRAS